MYAKQHYNRNIIRAYTFDVVSAGEHVKLVERTRNVQRLQIAKCVNVSIHKRL